jgi:hypothetical protein
MTVASTATLRVEDRQPVPFAMQVMDNPKVVGVLSGRDAMAKAGIQSEFAAANIMQASALKSSIILRAGDPPQYNKSRSPKSGVNLTKTSKQGFFKGALSQEERFARLEASGDPKPHNAKDANHLALQPTDPDFQHVMQLDINMIDILREVGPEGDLEVLGYDIGSSLLRLGYKEGHGPKTELFHGQFVVNIAEGTDIPIVYSREWDKPELNPNWDPVKQIITKPLELAAIPDGVYERVFNHTFMVGYTEDKIETPEHLSVKPANVFANRPRSAEEFKEAMGVGHPYFALIEDCTTLPKILDKLKTTLPGNEANQVILDVYNTAGSIVAGDWDGLALGHPPDLPHEFSQVINTFAPGLEGLDNQQLLLDRADHYLMQIKQTAIEAQEKGQPLSAFQKKALSISSITNIVSDFALARAGCITPHEFVFQQVLNSSYRDKANEHYGEKFNQDAMQNTLDRLLNDPPPAGEVKSRIEAVLNEELAHAGSRANSTITERLVEHIGKHFELAHNQGLQEYTLPHVQHDVNIHELYQHGFDMRNPYGSNLEGAWLLIGEDGGILYGAHQEQLIEVLLTGDFLEKNTIDVSHGADMDIGWGKVIERQIQLGQSIPEKTKVKYDEYKSGQEIETRKRTQSEMKSQVADMKSSIKDSSDALEVAPKGPESKAC